ncbi:glycoside hydrolase family 97 protein [Desertivirga arenae]|uniref:glycoside hydrolase family 97 protein n=1 Tax=Desertivirga arenae TaxID=2810309 RepID=UPI00211104E6|nr:glycoside hydrolase family 97 protein [Pedobacter sp. SYSU D00823]
MNTSKRTHFPFHSLGLFLFLITCFCFLKAQAQGSKRYTLASPDRQLLLHIEQKVNGEIIYGYSAHSKQLIKDSRLGFKAEEVGNIPSLNWKITSSSRKTVDSAWRPVWGKREIVRDHFNELILEVSGTAPYKSQLSIEFRAYNEGVAFRYRFPKESKSEHRVVSELTEFNFTGDFTAWYYNFEKHNIGPELLSIAEGERMPVMTIKAGSNSYMAVHEACLTEGEPMKLQSKKGEFKFSVASKPKLLYPGYQSAWRVIFSGTTPGQLVDSHLLELLNPAPTMDFSWVKPGIALWDWRIDGAEWDGFHYEMNYPSWVKMIDFAAEQGFPHLVLDANWYGPEFAKSSDPLKGDKAKDVQNIIQYGKERNVGVWLYLNDIGGKNFPIEQILKQYGEWGAAGVKYGFMTGKPEEKNARTRLLTELCAKNKLLIDFHDEPVHPYGQMRTWPNALTREYCKAQLDGHDIFYPKTFVTSAFVNMIAGPVDMNNGMFDLRQGKTTRKDNNMEVPSTVVSEAARTLITFSGATIIPDIPEYYQKYPELLAFLSAQKMPWKESKTLSGEIGEYIVTMRQATDNVYLIGAASNEKGRTLNIPLSFLPQGRFKAYIVQDGDDAHYLKNRETCKASEQEVTRKTLIDLKLAPGGGACIKLVRTK